jgi:hypothetical protein
MSEKINKGKLHSIVSCSIIDFIITEILEDGDKKYSELAYMKKLGLSRLVEKKSKLYGRVLA